MAVTPPFERQRISLSTPRRGSAPTRTLRSAVPASAALVRAQTRARAQRSSRVVQNSSLPPVSWRRGSGDGSGGGGGQKPPSLWGQATRLVTGLPQGLMGFGVDVATDVVSPIRVAADVVGGHGLRSVADYLPASTGIVRSASDTGERLLSTALPRSAERHGWSTYGEAVEGGNILGAVVEDIGNVALVGGAAGRALGTTSRTLTGLTAEEANALGRATRSAGAAVAEEVAPVGRVRTPLADVIDITSVKPPSSTYSVTLRGKGLAGMAERAGMPGAAETMSRAGGAIRRVSSFGEKAGNVPAAVYTYPLRKAGQLLGIEPGVIGRGVTRAAERMGARGLLFPHSTEGRTLSTIVAGSARSATDAARFVLDGARIAAEEGLTEAQGRAVGLSLDQPGFLQTARGLDDTEVTRLLDGMYPGVPEGMRPTLDDVKAAWAYAERKMTPDELRGMDLVRDRMRSVAEVRTGAQLREGTLNPEQVANELRPSVTEGQRVELEQTRNRIQRQFEPAHEAAIRETRIEQALDALAAELPPPPVARTEFETGRRVGREQGRDAARRQAHAQAQVDLNRAVDEYVRIAEGPATPDVQRAAAEVERLTQRAEEIRQLIQRTERREDAGTAFTRASGEVDVTPGGPRPEPSIIPARGEAQAIRRRADELREEQARQVFGEIEQMTEGSRPVLPRKGTAEREWWDALPASTRRRLSREKWVRSANEGGLSADEMADSIARTVGGDARDVNTQMMRYVEAVERYWEAKASKGSASMIELIATDLGIAPDRVAAALRGRIADYGDLLTSGAREALDDLRTGFRDLTADEQASFNMTLDNMIAEGDATPGDFADLLEMYLPAVDITGTEGVLSMLDNMTDLAEVVDWMRSEGELPPTITARLAERGAAQNRQLGRLAGDVQGARALGRENAADQRGARRVLDASERAAQAAEDAALRRMERSKDRADATAPELGPKLSEAYRASEDRTWKQTTGTTSTGETTNPMSPGERMRVKQGVQRERAAAARRRANRLGRSMEKITEKIADVETELGRSFQERVVDDLNRPAVARWRSIVDRSAPTLGGIEGLDDAATLTGLTRRLAGKYGIFDDVLSILDSMREDMRAQRRRDGDSDLAEVVGEGGAPMLDIPASEVGAVIDGVLDRKGIVMDPADRVQLYDAVGKGTLLEDMAVVMFENADSGVRLNAPMRVADVINNMRWRMPDDARTKLQAAIDGYTKRRGQQLARTYDTWAEALPARFRSVSQTGRRQIGALMDMAEEANRKAPGTGDVYLEMAEETMTTLSEMVEAGIDPTHLIGGREARGMSTTTTGRGGGTGQQRLRGERRRRSGLRQLSVDAYARVEAEQAMKLIQNRRNKLIGERLGKRADQIPEVAARMQEYADNHGGEPMPAVDAAKLVKDAGWVPQEDGVSVGPQTILLPKAVKDQLRPATFDIPLARALQRGNQMWKSWVLPFSPKWMIGNVLGNTIMAAVHAGVGPVELARRMRQIAKHEGGVMELWRRSGIPDWTPNEIADHGLTFNEYRILRNGEEAAPRTPIGKFAATSYRLNEFVDNMTRSSVYLAKLADGVPSEQALQTVLRSLGDYSNMSSFERRIVREVFPFYAWMRHSISATMRLPVTSPARAAIVLRLSDMYADPEKSNELMDLIGSRVPLGGNSFFDIGSVSPLAEIGAGGFALDPANLASSVSPILKVPTFALTGMDVNDFDQASRPAGTMARGVFGQEKATPPIRRLFSDPLNALGEIGYYAAGQSAAPIRSLRDLALGGEARYQTGYAVPDTTDPNRANRLGVILRGLNLPAPYTIDVEEFERRRAETIARQRG